MHLSTGIYRRRCNHLHHREYYSFGYLLHIPGHVGNLVAEAYYFRCCACERCFWDALVCSCWDSVSAHPYQVQGQQAVTERNRYCCHLPGVFIVSVYSGKLLI